MVLVLVLARDRPEGIAACYIVHSTGLEQSIIIETSWRLLMPYGRPGNLRCMQGRTRRRNIDAVQTPSAACDRQAGSIDRAGRRGECWHDLHMICMILCDPRRRSTRESQWKLVVRLMSHVKRRTSSTCTSHKQNIYNTPLPYTHAQVQHLRHTTGSTACHPRSAVREPPTTSNLNQ